MVFYQVRSGMLKSEDLSQESQIGREVKNEQKGNQLKVDAMLIAGCVKVKDLLETQVFDVNVSCFASIGLSEHPPQLCGNPQPSISSTVCMKNISYIPCPFGEWPPHLLIWTTDTSKILLAVSYAFDNTSTICTAMLYIHNQTSQVWIAQKLHINLILVSHYLCLP